MNESPDCKHGVRSKPALLLLCVLLGMGIVPGCGGGGGDGDGGPPAGGSSHWDEMVWDQDPWG